MWFELKREEICQSPKKSPLALNSLYKPQKLTHSDITPHSLWYHSKQQSLTIPVVICVSVSIFLCVHSCVLYVRWEVNTHIITTFMIIKSSSIGRICCWVILRNNLRKPFLLTRKNWRKVRLSQSLFRAKEYFQLMNYLIITRVKTFNIRTFTCLADG